MQQEFFENPDFFLYYDTANKKWFIKNNSNNIDYDLTMSDNLSSFLQIFYEDPLIFFTNLSKKAKEKNIDEKVLEYLPFKESIIFCIKNKMFFWLELALKWLQFINVDDELKTAIKTVIDDTKTPQTIRHRLIKVISHKESDEKV